jgi:hypothetical protein
MRTLPDAITVKPFFLGALFGAKPLSLTIQRNNVEISHQNNTVKIPFEEIPASAAVTKGIIFDKVQFVGTQQSLIANWLISSDAQRILDLALDKYHRVIANTINDLCDSIEKQLRLRYPRKQDWLRLREECRLWRKRFKRLPTSENNWGQSNSN